MKVYMGYDNDLAEKIAFQVMELCLPACIPEEKIEKMEVYISETTITISVYLHDSIIEIPDVYFDGIWGIQQCNPPELHSGEMHCRKLLSPKEPL